MKTGRREDRKHAVQILYQLDLNQDLSAEKALELFKTNFSISKKGASDFCKQLVLGVVKHIEELDRKITQVSENWRLDRMPIIDRNILRMGSFELFHCNDIPSTVTINEMVELAKEFGSEESSLFVNGILDKLKVNHPEKAP